MVLQVIMQNINIDKKIQEILIKKCSKKLNFLLKKTKQNYIIKYNFINFSKKKKLYTVLASPHINKKAREQFNLIKYIKAINIIIYKNLNKKLYSFLLIYNNYIINNFLKNIYNNIYLKNYYKYSLKKVQSKFKYIKVKYKI